MTVKGWVGASLCIEFIQRLLQGASRMIFPIVDGHPTHKTKRVKTFLESNAIKQRFRLFFLPPYSPELNPDERVWNDLKNHGATSLTPRHNTQADIATILRWLISDGSGGR